MKTTNLPDSRFQFAAASLFGPKIALPLLFVLTTLLLLIFAGCQTTNSTTISPLQLIKEIDSTTKNDGGRISLFLSLKMPPTIGIKMTVSAIEILNNETWLPITSQPVTINAAEIGPGQIFLGRGFLPPGQYRRLRFTLQQASIQKKNGDNIFLALDNPTIEIDLPAILNLLKDDSHSLFLTWDEEGSMPTSPIFSPSLAIEPNLKQMTTDLAYAACPDINTIYVLRTDKNWVCDSFGITGQPSNMTAMTTDSQKRLYILSPPEAQIKVVELPANEIVTAYPIPMTTSPSFMTLSDDGKRAYILDSSNDYLFRINLSTGDLEARIQLGSQPEYATYIYSHNLLAVSSTLSQTVTLLDSNSMTEVAEINTTGVPGGLLAWNNLLYITESDNNTVAVYDLNLRAITSRRNVGFHPHRLLPNEGYIYVSNRNSNSISIIQPEQLGIALEINLNGSPQEMMVAPNSRWIYVGNKDIGGLSVIDATSNQVTGQISFGATPMSLAVVQ